MLELVKELHKFLLEAFKKAKTLQIFKNISLTDGYLAVKGLNLLKSVFINFIVDGIDQTSKLP